MTAPDAGDHLARDIATTGIYHAANLYTRVSEQAVSGDVSQGLLRTRRTALEDAASIYAAAHGWQTQEPEA